MLNDSGIVEFVSRKGRLELVRLIVSKAREKAVADRQQNRKVGRIGYLDDVAKNLGISRDSVKKWLAQEYQASDKVAQKLVIVAMTQAKEETTRILMEEFEEHKRRIDSYTASLLVKS